MKKVFAILFSLLIVVTNVGVTFATHYCGGQVIKRTISLGQNDIGCGMDETDQSCENPSLLNNVTSKRCCENTYVQLKVKDNYQAKEIFKSTINFNFIVALINSYSNLYSFNASAEADYTGYSPPLLVLDIPVLIQSFLI